MELNDGRAVSCFIHSSIVYHRMDIKITLVNVYSSIVVTAKWWPEYIQTINFILKMLFEYKFDVKTYYGIHDF